jgi:deoxyribose-phosphate aldolase
MTQLSLSGIAKMIDHSLLHPTLTDEELRKGCELARRLRVASVCIKPYAVPLAKSILTGSDVAVGTVVGFPHGNSHIAIKSEEAERACTDGATELDMVVNVGKVLSRDWNYVELEIHTIVKVVHQHNAILKVIFENDFLVQDEFKIKLCEICSRVAADFVKTSTGFGFVKQSNNTYNYRGATEQDCKLMRSSCLHTVQIKAAGGIRTLDEVLRFRSLGVTRIGATATETILREALNRGMR